MRYSDKRASSDRSDLFSDDERYLHALSKASSELSKPSVIIFLSSGIFEAPMVSRFVTFSGKKRNQFCAVLIAPPYQLNIKRIKFKCELLVRNSGVNFCDMRGSFKFFTREFMDYCFRNM